MLRKSGGRTVGKWQKLFMFVLGMGIVFALSGGRAEAAKVFDSESHSPSSHRTLCDAGTPVDFSAYPSDISIDLNTGTMSYNINVQWAPCSLTALRAYAIYSVGQEVCPISGTYGASDAQGGIVTDCVKYIGSPPYQGSGNGLSCGAGWYGQPGVNEQCVAQNFVGVRRSENQPTTAGSAVIPMQTVIPNWGSQADTGSWTIDNAMCQFYKTGGNFTTYTNDRCINIVMKISWKTKTVAPNLSCSGVSTNPSNIEQGQLFSLTGGFDLSGGEGLSGQTSYTMTVSIPAAGISNQAVATDQATGWSGSGAGTLAGISIPSLGVHPVSYTVSVVGASGSPQTCTGSVRVAKRPFVSFYGGDVKVGGGFGQTNCNRISNIDTYTNSANLGSGVQFAVQALGTITGFSSSRLTQPPKTLTFANTVAGLGGLFNADQCITDYFALGNGLPVSSSPTADISTSGSRKYNAAITSLSGNLAPGVRAKIFVLGDLRITGNIDYTTPNWVGIQDIPSLQVFVSGNIYIDPGVSRITGMFVAQPRTGVANTGTIVTCSKNGTSTYAPSELYDSPCNSRLSVRGSFIAEKIRFTRVAGSLQEAVAGTENRAATSRAGEIFELTPDIYLANPGTTSSTGTYGDKYDFITALPPIL